MMALFQTIPSLSWAMAWAGSVLWAYVCGAARRKKSKSVILTSGYAAPVLYEQTVKADPIDNIMRRMRESESAQKPRPVTRRNPR